MKYALKRKNFYLDQAKINKVKRILGTKTETETIHQALDLALFQKEILGSLEQVKGKGHIEFIR